MLDREIIREDSPLRRVPAKLHHRQRLFGDGVRYSIEMADIAYVRLCRAAIEIGRGDVVDAERGGKPHFTAIPAMMLDAWSVVDSVQRLRTLIRGFPHLSNFDWKKLFLRQTEPVETLRNCVQHVVEEYEPSATANDLPWGQLSWIYGPREDGTVRMPRVISGALAFKFAPPVLKPQSFMPPLDRIILSAFDNELNLSDTMGYVQRMAGEFETTWAKSTAELGGHLASDLIMVIELRAGPDSPKSEGA